MDGSRWNCAALQLGRLEELTAGDQIFMSAACLPWQVLALLLNNRLCIMLTVCWMSKQASEDLQSQVLRKGPGAGKQASAHAK